MYMYYIEYETYLGSEEWTFVTLTTIIVLQAMIFLSGQWNIKIKAKITCLKVNIERKKEYTIINAKSTRKTKSCQVL